MFNVMKSVFSILAASLLSSAAQAGVSTSGGGYGVACFNGQGQITSIELLDLYEARNIHGLTLMASTQNFEADYINSVNNTYQLQAEAPQMGDTNSWITYKNLRRFKEQIIWVKNLAELPKTQDLGPTEHLKGKLAVNCRLEQVAFMDDRTRKIHIVKSYWEKMSSLSQAALIQHELFYMNSRNFVLLPESSSESIRLEVGMIFSKNNLLSAIHGVPQDVKPHTIFHDLNSNENGRWDSTSYYSFPTGTFVDKIPVTRNQFTQLGGRPILSKTYVDIPQRVNYMDRFPIQSYQLKGWIVVVMPDTSPTGVKLRILNAKGQAVLDLRSR